MDVHGFGSLIQSELLTPSVSVPGWYNYEVRASNFRNDLEELSKFKNEKIIIEISIKSKYNQDGIESNRLEDVQELMGFRGLNICQNFENLDLINGLSNLEVLMLHTQDHLPLNIRKKPVDLNGLTYLRHLSLPVAPEKKVKFGFFELTGLEYLSIPHFDQNDLQYVDWISSLKNLRAISLHRPKIKSLNWLQNPMLQFLQIDYAKNLQSLSSGCAYNDLEYVDLQNCPNLTAVDRLSESEKLMLLRIWGSQKLETLSFLKGASIQCLDFYESSVADGDLSFIETLEDLKHLRFTNKRHFSYSLKDFLDKGSIEISSPSLWFDYRDNVLGHIL